METTEEDAHTQTSSLKKINFGKIFSIFPVFQTSCIVLFEPISNNKKKKKINDTLFFIFESSSRTAVIY